MRILFDSKQPQFKSPFGVLTPGQVCTLHVHIPTSVCTRRVEIVLCYEDGSPARYLEMRKIEQRGAYDIWQGEFSLFAPGLHFYYFQIHDPHGMFRLFKQGDDANMEAGDLWQVSCVPPDFTTPDWAKGAVIYQIFPDRFRRSGKPDLTGKLEPYTVHSDWYEDVDWAPDENGVIQNNDFFGGNFQGITEKMDYIASLGVTILYLNPISKSFSNHRYDTGDYKTPDPMLGTEEDFSKMCQAAHQRGIKVILDGVYSHTGSDSLYFDRKHTFGGKGAFCSQQSPYYNWYTFYEWPINYHSWWNFDTLPTVNKMHPDFIKYIITDEDSVVAHWMKLGADGYRLDVADELPDDSQPDSGNQARCPAAGRGVGGCLQQNGLRQAAAVLYKRRAGQRDELSFPHRHSGLYARPGQRPPAAGYGDVHCGELSAPGGCLQHEPAGHPRHPPDPHRPGGRFRRQPGGKSPPASVPEPIGGGKGPADDGLLPPIHPARRSQPLLWR